MRVKGVAALQPNCSLSAEQLIAKANGIESLIKDGNMKAVLLLVAVVALQGCVTPGYEGQVGNLVDSDQMFAQREANRSVSMLSDDTSGYRPMSSVSVRRCHRSFIEAEPNQTALIEDLKRAAFTQGADAISDISQRRINGLMANCWYVVEASANTWARR